MNLYAVYQQRPPVATKTNKVDEDGKPSTEWEAHLRYVGEVKAYTGSHAIDVARETLDAFKTASRKTLAAFPIVEQV